MPLPPPVIAPPASRAGSSRADLLSKFDSRFDQAVSGSNPQAEQVSQEPSYRVPTLATRHSMAGRCAPPPLLRRRVLKVELCRPCAALPRPALLGAQGSAEVRIGHFLV